MRQPLEEDEQKKVVEWLLKRGVFVYHIPNHKEMRQDIGAIPGMPDLQIVLTGGKVIWVEMKRRAKAKVRKCQAIIHKELRALGHTVIVAKGAKDAVAQILALDSSGPDGITSES